MALLAPQQTALYLVAGPHYDSGGHRRCDRAVGQPVQLGDFRPHGQATTLPWGFEFVRSHKWVAEFAPAAVHPTQIYEALCYLATFGILCWLYYAKDIARRRPGILFGIGLLGIFLTRFFIEFIKTEQEAFEQGWLLDMGQWLHLNGEAIYASKPWRGKVEGNPQMYCTQRDGNLYIICMQWPRNPIKVTGLTHASGAKLLGSNAKVTTVMKGAKLIITVPPLTIDQLPSQLAWVIKIKA